MNNEKPSINVQDGSLGIWFESCDEKLLKTIMISLCARLRKSGWNIHVPYEEHKDGRNGKRFDKRWAERHRKGFHSGLELEANLHGRCLDFKFWENVIDHTDENRSGGRYIFDKESKMPYLVRIRLAATKQLIINHLKKHYEAEVSDRSKFFTKKLKPAIERVMERIKSSGHYDAELGHARIHGSYNKTLDGKTIKHGQFVYTTDYKGRVITGHAYYDLNMNWNIVTGKYGRLIKHNHEIWANNPGDLRTKRNERRARRALEDLMARSIKAMDFDKAKIIKGVLFGDQPLFHVIKDGLYYRPNGSGYTNDSIDAGKYTEEEVAHYRTCSELSVKPIYQDAA